MVLIGNGVLFTNNEQNQIIADGCVVADGDTIVDFGTTSAMKALYKGEFLDACGKIIMPGFINAHAHFYSAMARGMPALSASPSKNFGDILNNLWWPLDKALTMEDIRYSALIAGIECVKNGVTTVFDHHASYGAIPGSLSLMAETIAPLGLRASLCYEVSDRGGKKDFEAAVAENVSFIKDAQKRFGKRFSGLFGLHAAFTLSDESLETCRDAVRSLNASMPADKAQNVPGSIAGFHVHVAEGTADVADARQKGYAGVAERLNHFGIFDKNTIAVHCIHISEAEEQILRDSGAVLVHNPQSNMGNAVGCARVPELITKGVPVALGTDGYTADVLASMKTANILHKHRLGDPSAMWGEPPTMLLKTNRLLAERHFSEQIGIIAKGASADVITINYFAPTPLTADNFYSHLHFGIQGSDVWDVIAAGKTVMKARVLTVLDEEKTLAKAREQSQKLWSRLTS